MASHRSLDGALAASTCALLNTSQRCFMRRLDASVHTSCVRISLLQSPSPPSSAYLVHTSIPWPRIHLQILMVGARRPSFACAGFSCSRCLPSAILEASTRDHERSCERQPCRFRVNSGYYWYSDGRDCHRYAAQALVWLAVGLSELVRRWLSQACHRHCRHSARHTCPEDTYPVHSCACILQYTS